jgi:hypothetical protein
MMVMFHGGFNPVSSLWGRCQIVNSENHSENDYETKSGPFIWTMDSGIELPDDWGIFCPGCAHHQRPPPAGPGLVRTPDALDNHAFAVKAPYFKRVMAALRVRAGQEVEHARASDWGLADLLLRPGS